MPSTRLTDCVPWLGTAWLEIEEEYARERAGHRLVITCTHRKPEEQFILYCKGRRQIEDGSWVVDADPKTAVVTNCDGTFKVSRHNKLPAEALDFAVVVGGKVSWDRREYEPVGLLAEQRGLIWGGRWTKPPLGPDAPHVEVPS